jgi:hypothetical protein
LRHSPLDPLGGLAVGEQQAGKGSDQLERLVLIIGRCPI